MALGLKKIFYALFPEFGSQDKIKKILLGLIRISLIIAIIVSAFNLNWFSLFVSSLTLFLTFLPYFFEQSYKIDIPVEIEIIAIVFIYAAIFLGETQRFYIRFWWWDIFLHTLSGIALAFVGFLIMYFLYSIEKIKAKPITIVVFSFCFALALGTLWEIFEFAMDGIFATNMQKSGLVDTMWDLIVDASGAFFVSVLGYIYLKGAQIGFIDKIICTFIKNNPQLFKNNKIKKQCD